MSIMSGGKYFVRRLAGPAGIQLSPVGLDDFLSPGTSLQSRYLMHTKTVWKRFQLDGDNVPMRRTCGDRFGFPFHLLFPLSNLCGNHWLYGPIRIELIRFPPSPDTIAGDPDVLLALLLVAHLRSPHR